MPRSTIVTEEEAIEAIQKTGGRIPPAADLLGISIATFYNYLERWEGLSAALDEARSEWDQKLVTRAEYALAEAVRSGLSWAVRFVLTTKAKDQYSTSPETAIALGVNVAVDNRRPSPEEDAKRIAEVLAIVEEQRLALDAPPQDFYGGAADSDHEAKALPAPGPEADDEPGILDDWSKVQPPPKKRAPVGSKERPYRNSWSGTPSRVQGRR
jgi:hypothetical protein